MLRIILVGLGLCAGCSSTVSIEEVCAKAFENGCVEGSQADCETFLHEVESRAKQGGCLASFEKSLQCLYDEGSEKGVCDDRSPCENAGAEDESCTSAN